MAGLYLLVRTDASQSIPIWLVTLCCLRVCFTSLIALTKGLSWDQLAADPQLRSKRTTLIQEAATKLSQARMIAFDRQAESFVITDLGRIAAKYYIRYASVEVFNQQFKPKMSEADVLAMLCMSTEVRNCLCRTDFQSS